MNLTGLRRWKKTGPGFGLLTGAPLEPFPLPKPAPLTGPATAPLLPEPVTVPAIGECVAYLARTACCSGYTGAGVVGGGGAVSGMGVAIARPVRTMTARTPAGEDQPSGGPDGPGMFGFWTGPPAFHCTCPVPNEVSAAGGVQGVPAGRGFCGGGDSPI